MSRKLTIEEVRKLVEDNGFELLSNEYIDNKTKLKMKDSEGYLYSLNVSSLKKDSKYYKFDKANEYTIDNLKYFLSLNFPEFELKDDKFVNSSTKLTLETKEGYRCLVTSTSLSTGKRPMIFHTSNPHVTDNINIFLNIKLKGFKLLDNNYKGKKYPITLIDNLGYKYKTYLSTIKNDSKPCKFDSANPFTIENIKLWLTLNDYSIDYLSGDYKEIKSDLKWKCNKCGEHFTTKFYYFYYYKSECPFCANQKIGESNCLATKNPELTKEFHPDKNGDLTPYNIPESYKHRVWWQCSKNKNHIWKTNVKRRNEGWGCPYCNKTRASDEYNLLIDNPELCKEWDYDKNKTKPEQHTPYSGKKVWWKCKKCKKEWKTAIALRNLYGNLCSCGKFVSRGETKIKDFLDLHNIKYESQYKLDECRDKLPLPFDFYFPDYEKMCEYNGSQHYEPHEYFGGEKRFKIQQKHDQIKRDYCKQNNIKLIEIPYWDFDNIEEILIRELDLKEVKRKKVGLIHNSK